MSQDPNGKYSYIANAEWWEVGILLFIGGAAAIWFAKMIALAAVAFLLSLITCVVMKRKGEALITSGLLAASYAGVGYFKYKTLENTISATVDYLKNFSTIWDSKITVDSFFKASFYNPAGFLFLATIGFLAGAIFYYYGTTRTLAQIAKDEATADSSTRYDYQGNPVGFFDTRKKQSVRTETQKKPKESKANKESHAKYNATVIGAADGKIITIGDDEAAGHGLIVGASGAGKTTEIMNFVESCAEREIPCFYVDGKGDQELPGQIRDIANKYYRPFYHFDMRGTMSNTPYNPLKIGDDSAIRDKLINLTTWTEPHYKVNSERAILLIVNVLDQVREETSGMDPAELEEYFNLREGEKTPSLNRDVNNIKALLKKDRLQQLISYIKDQETREEYQEICDSLNESYYSGLESRLGLLSENRKLKLLLQESGNGIDLLKALKEKAIVVFSLDSLQNKSSTEMLGRLIVNDINTVISLKGDKAVSYAIYDEHGAYISEEVESQFAMARSFGMRVITSSQEISDYEKSDLGDILKKKVIGNTNFKIILRQNDPENTEYLAQVFGTKKRLNKTMSTDSVGNFKGLSLEEQDEFQVHPNVIKQLETGQAVVLIKAPQRRVVEKLHVRQVK